MVRHQRLTFDYLLGLARTEGLIEPHRVDELASEQSAQLYRIRRSMASHGKGSLEEVGPITLLASFNEATHKGVLSEDHVMQLIAKAESLTYQKIDPLKLDAALITSTLSRPFAKKHCLLPLKRQHGTLTIATNDPFNHDALEMVRNLSGGNIEVVLSSGSDIQKCIREVYGFRRTLAAAAADLDAGDDLGNFEQLFQMKSLDELESNDQHIVNAVDYLLRYALEQGASDLHLEPKRNAAQVRLRIDGVLHTVQRVPMTVQRAMVSRVKTLARMDIAEKRRPQDGRIKTFHDQVEVELRVSTLPVAFGEKLVLRIFDPEVLLQDLEQLGFSSSDYELFEGFIARPHGLILVTGPTGSGKTTTLYSALQVLANERVNVTTIEDPIEMVVEDFNQTAVVPKAGISFASCLRTILRQDPDVIMVGEIRDSETAKHAIQAAMTGHLVISTLHTNDSAGALARLQELGVEPFLIASTVIGVVAQRLVRRVCDSCRDTTTLSREQLVALGLPVSDEGTPPELPVAFGKGCPDCRHTGLRGRTAVFEILPISPSIRAQIIEGVPANDMMRTARHEGMTTLRENALKKLAQGETSFEEVLRVTVDTP